MLDEWAFARVELNLSDSEFFALSPRQWDAFLDQWQNKKQREFALQMTCSLNARWGSAKNIMPFKMADFLPREPKSEEEEALDEDRLQRAKTTVLLGFYQDLVKELPPITKKKKPKSKTKKKRARK